MDNETAKHMADLWDTILNQWEFVASVFVVMNVSIMWSLKQVFATQRRVEDCKREMLDSLERHEEREEERQIRLEEKVDRLIDKLI